ncbi:HIR2 [Candida pseudojiufengensis]|uniref:HIR2 n=1 Tax=Candida pseudojiufengensis TaxID=497109 RepID=UPI002223F63C|nr:HIR2 [Candida pseudojiufengensis]KAI5964112.1 HIR2 [Candida pseudojiufengensis]
MKFLLLPQTYHSGEIHCLDINNDNSGLITGGVDNYINVWNLQELIHISKLEQSESKNTQRHQIEHIKPIHSILVHKSTVNILKWLPNAVNKFISSDTDGNIYYHDLRDDDKSIHNKLFPFNKETSSELSPVVDLTISRDGRLVAWSTNDEKIYVIDIERNTFQELKPISNEKPVVHRSLAFNNTTNYLVAVGDDTQLNVFQYEFDNTGSYKFRCINKITRLFSNNTLNVKYKRISWSPDGELLSVPTASKGQTTLISLISSTFNWTNRESLVGHDLSCEVVKFSPNIYSKKESDDEELYNILASGGSDKTLAIWNTSNSTPILLLENLVANAQIYDLAWTDTENIIFCTSSGQLGIVTFEEHELGFPVDEVVVENLKKLTVEKMKALDYRYEYDQSSGSRKVMAPLEFADQERAIKIAKDKQADDHSQKAIEIVSEPEVEDNQIKGSIEPKVIEPTQPRNDSNLATPKSVSIQNTPPLEAKQTRKPNPPTQELNLNKQKSTTKNGKRRIQPTLLTNNDSVSTTNTLVRVNSTQSNAIVSKDPMEFDKASYSVTDEFYRSKRIRQEDTNGTIKKPKREMEPIKYIGSVIINPNTSFAKTRLSAPKIKFEFQLKGQKAEDLYTLDIKNGSGNETKPSRVTCFRKDKEIWCDFIPKLIQLACEGGSFWAIATADGQILTYSHLSGKRILPPIILGSSLAYLESHSKYLMAVTTLGELYVWNLEIKKIELNCSISGLLDLNSRFQDDGLTKSDTITLCAVTSLGIPLVTLSNGSGYLYNKELATWQTITEAWWLFGSHYWDSTDDGKNSLQSLNMFDDEDSILEVLENKTNEEVIKKTRTGRGKFFNKISKNMLMKEGFESLENTISISHLENRILCCEILGESKDFHKYFKTYVQRICELGFKAKLFEVCDELLGPTDDVDSQNQWNPKICGFNKRDLLKEVITLCSQYRDAQRVLYHFSSKIGMINDELDGNGME